MLVRIGRGHAVNTDYLREVWRDPDCGDEACWVVTLDPSMAQPGRLRWDDVVTLLRSLGWDDDELASLLSGAPATS